MDAKAKVIYYDGTPLVTLTDHEAALAELQAERDSFAKHCELLTHKVITCGVAARHPDAGLSKRGAYAGKWDSPQAQDVRDLRDAKDAAEVKLTTLLTGLEALAGELDTIADVKFKRHNKQKGIVNNFTDHDKGEVYEDCAEQLRTLASAGLEGNRNSATNDGERNGL